MRFADISVGTVFFDPFSGENFRKVDEGSAVQLTGGDYVEGALSDFGAQEEIE